MAKKAKGFQKNRQRAQKVQTAGVTARPEEISQELNTIFKARWHGAVNIRGIRFQILYSLFCALSLYNEEKLATTIRLEGIEDLDLVGFHQQNEFVQVKSADKPWKWNQLKKPIEGFLPVLRNNDHCDFVLAINFPLTSDIERLAQLELLPASERERIEEKLHKLCAQVSYSESESIALTHRLKIVSISEK